MFSASSRPLQEEGAHGELPWSWGTEQSRFLGRVFLKGARYAVRLHHQKGLKATKGIERP